MDIVNYYRVDDTGASDFESWFQGDDRFTSFEEAKKYAINRRTFLIDLNSLVRIVEVNIFSSEDQRITIESYRYDF